MTARESTEGRRPSLADRAYADLRWRILSGELRSGVLMTEGEVCALTGAGKAPVRAALAELRHDRLIDIVPRRGFFVRPWSAAEAAELMAARALIEPEVAALAARHRRPEDIAALDAILTRTEDAARDIDRRALVMLDRDFHIAIARASGNGIFADMVTALKNRSHHHFHIAVSAPAFVARVIRDHRAIRDAVAGGDPAASAAAMRAHIAALRPADEG